MQLSEIQEHCIPPALAASQPAGTQTELREAADASTAAPRRPDKGVQASEPTLPVPRGHGASRAEELNDPRVLAALEQAYAVLLSSAPERARVTAFLASRASGARTPPKTALVDVGSLFREELLAVGGALSAARGESAAPAPARAVYRHYSHGRLVYVLGRSIYFTPSLWPREESARGAAEPCSKRTLYACPFASAADITALKAHPTMWRTLALGDDRGGVEIVIADFSEGKRRQLAATGSTTPVAHGSPVLLLEWVKVDVNTVGLLSVSRNGRVLVWKLAEQEAGKGRRVVLLPVAGCALLARTKTKLRLGRELTSACYCTVGVSLSSATLLVSGVEGQVVEFSFSLRREAALGSLDALADASKAGLRVGKHFATAPGVRKVSYLDPLLVEAGVRDGCSTTTVLAAKGLMLLLSGRGDVCLVDGVAAAASGVAAGPAILKRYVLPEAQEVVDFVTASRYLVLLTARDALAVFDLGRASSPAVTVDLRARGFCGGERLQMASGVNAGVDGQAPTLTLHVSGEELSLIIEAPLPAALQTDRGFLEGLVAQSGAAEALAGR